jgi:UDP-glucose 4-epimerase
MNILVTGGAGYVGSVCSEQLIAQGHRVVILDNLVTGHRKAVPTKAVFIEGDISQGSVVSKAITGHAIAAVMHFAGETLVTKSMTDPRCYFENNLCKGVALLDTIMQHGVRQIIFSSTAAVFGEPLSTPITEEHPTNPINAYGESKLMFEKILSWYSRAYGLRYIAVRYFNAAGASANFGEAHRPETHLIPLLLESAQDGNKEFRIYGDDYSTHDGTCVRDYVHVLDIAQAHIRALHAVEQGRSGVYNVGSSTGYSVREVVHAVQAITCKDLRIRTVARRPGDPAVLVAGNTKLVKELGWTPQYSDLLNIISSAWTWKQQHRDGY